MEFVRSSLVAMVLDMKLSFYTILVVGLVEWYCQRQGIRSMRVRSEIWDSEGGVGGRAAMWS